MPDPQLLPPGRVLEAYPPDLAVLPHLQLRARHRRRRRAAALSGAAASVVVAVVLASSVPASPSRESLRPADPASPTPKPQRTTTAGAQEPVSLGDARPNVAPQEAGAPSTVAAPSVTPPTVMRRAYGGRPADPDATAVPPTSVPSTPCSPSSATDGWPTATEGWCVMTFAFSDSSSDDVDLTLWVCRGATDGTGRLEWPTSQQVDFEIRDRSGRVVYTYDPRVRPTPFQRDVLPGDCLEWAVTWDRTDEQGRALPPGQYQLRGWSTAPALRGRVDSTNFSQ